MKRLHVTLSERPEVADHISWIANFDLELRDKLNCTAQQHNMSKARAATDQVVKLIVGAGQASPSPPVGPALGSKGVKSMDFCKVLISPAPF